MERVSGFCKFEQISGFCIVDLHFPGVVGVVEAVNEDAGKVPFEREVLLHFPVELRGPEVSRYGRLGGTPDTFSILAEVPVSGLQDSVLPELGSEHLLEQEDHRSQTVGHPVVHLLECNHKDMNPLDLILESGHQILNGLLFFHQLIPEARGVDDGELFIFNVAKPISPVSTRVLGHAALQPAAHLEAAVSELPPVVILVPAEENVCQTGLADTCPSEDDNSGKGNIEGRRGEFP